MSGRGSEQRVASEKHWLSAGSRTGSILAVPQHSPRPTLPAAASTCRLRYYSHARHRHRRLLRHLYRAIEATLRPWRLEARFRKSGKWFPTTFSPSHHPPSIFPFPRSSLSHSLYSTILCRRARHSFTPPPLPLSSAPQRLRMKSWTSCAGIFVHTSR